MDSKYIKGISASERTKIVQSVIDRMNEYGDEYIEKLELINQEYLLKKNKSIGSPRKIEDLVLPPNVRISKTILPN